jgi:hypothetical protein
MTITEQDDAFDIPIYVTNGVGIVLLGYPVECSCSQLLPGQPKGITKIRHRCPCVRDSVRAVVSLVTNLIYREFTAKDANLSPFCRADKVLL